VNIRTDLWVNVELLLRKGWKYEVVFSWFSKTKSIIIVRGNREVGGRSGYVRKVAPVGVDGTGSR
jgi:hypothetical protein